MRFNEMNAAMHDQLDFVPRSQRNGFWRMVLAFIATILLVLISLYAPPFPAVETFGPLIAVLVIAALCIYVMYRSQVNLDLVMSTEYQNLLFAQALTQGCSFCLIARRDGTILYADDGLANVFPSFNYSQSRSLEGVFEQGVVRAVDRERIMGAIHSGSAEHLIFPIFSNATQKKDYIITVEALARPSGFSILRGREYLGHRSGAEMLPDILRSTTIDKLDRLLTTTPTAHYVTNTYGRFEYVNPAFEHLLGYEPGEILASKLHVHHVFVSMGNLVLTEEYTLSDYGGQATLAKKRGGREMHTVVQYVMRDNNGKIAGATGSIFPHAQA